MDLGAVLNPTSESSGPPATSLGGPSYDASKPKAGGGLMDQWNSWLQQPGNQGALISAGLQMMQPIGVGQSVLGHVARAIGKGAEAKTELQQTGVENRLKTAQSQYYETGGGRSGVNAQDNVVKRQYTSIMMTMLKARAAAAFDPAV